MREKRRGSRGRSLKIAKPSRADWSDIMDTQPAVSESALIEL
jgi:hypothetical protein